MTASVPQEVGFHEPAHRIRPCCRWRAVGGIDDAGIVDQNVQPAISGRNLFCGSCDCLLVVEVDLEGLDCQSRFRKLGGRLLTACSIARTHQNLDIRFRELAGDLQPDALVGAGDERDAFGVPH